MPRGSRKPVFDLTVRDRIEVSKLQTDLFIDEAAQVDLLYGWDARTSIDNIRLSRKSTHEVTKNELPVIFTQAHAREIGRAIMAGEVFPAAIIDPELETGRVFQAVCNGEYSNKTLEGIAQQRHPVRKSRWIDSVFGPPSNQPKQPRPLVADLGNQAKPWTVATMKQDGMTVDVWPIGRYEGSLYAEYSRSLRNPGNLVVNQSARMVREALVDCAVETAPNFASADLAKGGRVLMWHGVEADKAFGGAFAITSDTSDSAYSVDVVARSRQEPIAGDQVHRQPDDDYLRYG